MKVRGRQGAHRSRPGGTRHRFCRPSPMLAPPARCRRNLRVGPRHSCRRSYRAELSEYATYVVVARDETTQIEAVCSIR